MSAHSIVVATSIPPTLSRNNAGQRIDAEYQRLCIASWRECGMRVVSVNDADEIPALAGRYPEVTFYPAQRSAQATFGPKTPFITDLLLTLAVAPESVVGIVNADIVLEPGPMWREMAKHFITGNSVAFARRYEARSLTDGPLVRYVYGFDCFFLDRVAAGHLAAETRQFAMGLPWWDYWLPLALALRGYDLLAIRRPASIHLIHDSTRAPVAHTPNWRRLALDLAASLVEERGGKAIPEKFTALRLSCQKLLASPDTDLTRSTLDNDIVDLCHAALRAMDDNSQPVNLSAPNENTTLGEATLSAIFARFEDRAIAGQAIYTGAFLERDGRLREAELAYRAALARMPDDAGLLTALGVCLSQQRNFAEAIYVLRKAADGAPWSCEILNSLGMCWASINRLDEAILCLEKALKLDPEYGLTYYDLAMVLSLTNRHDEAIARLEAARAARPGFRDADEWLQKIHGRLRSSDKVLSKQ